jgi:DNA-binding CsgD family transcriptional regulator
VPSSWSQDALDEVIAQIYRATTEPELWDSVLETIARKLTATLAAIHVRARATEIAPIRTLAAWGARGSSGLRDYQTNYGNQNVWMTRGAHLLEPGAVLTGEDMCPDEAFLCSPFYVEFLRPLDIRYSIRAVLTADPEPLTVLAAGRPHASRPFGKVERLTLGKIAPHVAQAVRIHARLESIESGERAASGALERLPLAVIFLDKKCRVVQMNSAARRIVDSGDGLKVERGVLTALDTRAEVQLQQMIFGAAALDTGRFLQHGGSLALPRPEGRRPLSAMVAPTGITGIFSTSRSASVVVLIEEPDRREAAPFDEFSKAHRLSPAEAGLAARLVGGLSLRQAAQAVGITQNTARTHLKHVFSKTGAKRQADLVRRVLTHDMEKGETRSERAAPKTGATHPSEV